MSLKCIILFCLSYSFFLAKSKGLEETEMADGTYLDILEEMMIDDNVIIILSII